MSRKKNEKNKNETVAVQKALPVEKNGKKISVMIPCYNEVENVVPMSEAVCSLMEKELPAYDHR